MSLSPFNEGSARLTIAIVRDVSDAHMTRETASALALAQERERIAHELLDSVIRHLFDIGLTVTAQIAQRNEVGDTAHKVVDEIDETIREIRKMVFDARPQGRPSRPDFS